MELLLQQITRLCRQLGMHRILSSSNSSNNKHLMHGRSLKESSSGKFDFFTLKSRRLCLSLQAEREPAHRLKAYLDDKVVIINNMHDVMYYGGVTIQ